jgi:hypothetical protein
LHIPPCSIDFNTLSSQIQRPSIHCRLKRVTGHDRINDQIAGRDIESIDVADIAACVQVLERLKAHHDLHHMELRVEETLVAVTTRIADWKDIGVEFAVGCSGRAASSSNRSIL